MSRVEPAVPPSTNASVWAGYSHTPLRMFLRTESGGAALLLGAAVIAMLWVNLAPQSYTSLWSTELALSWGDREFSLTAVEWINSGLMAFYFFVVGLETRREFDIGELRERRRVILPVVAGVAGMAASTLLFVAITASDGTAHGWGIALSTDTAFALGVLAIVGPRFSDWLRAFLLTVLITDDVIALAVIATVYTENLVVGPLLVVGLLVGLIVAMLRLHVRGGLVYFVVGVAAWFALARSGPPSPPWSPGSSLPRRVGCPRVAACALPSVTPTRSSTSPSRSTHGATTSADRRSHP